MIQILQIDPVALSYLCAGLSKAFGCLVVSMSQIDPTSKRFRAGLAILLGVCLGFKQPKIVKAVMQYGYTRQNAYVMLRQLKETEYFQPVKARGGAWGIRGSRAYERGRPPSKLEFIKPFVTYKLKREAIKEVIPSLILAGEAEAFLKSFFDLLKRGLLAALMDAFDKLGIRGRKYSSEVYSQVAEVLKFGIAKKVEEVKGHLGRKMSSGTDMHLMEIRKDLGDEWR